LLTFCALQHKRDVRIGTAGFGESRQWRSAPGEGTMIKSFEDVQKYNKDNMDVAMKSFGTVSKSFQAIATEIADFSKKSFEEGSAALEKLLGAKSLDKAIEVQTDYLKSTYEGFVSEATKLGDLYSEFAKESYKPFESFLNRAPVK
jgi:hypothetical protein